MKVHITSSAMLKKLTGSQLKGYLHGKGWRFLYPLQEPLTDKGEIWENPKDKDKETVTVPLDPEFGDYATRVAAILSALSEYENRNQLEIYNDIAAIGQPSIGVRVQTATSAHGKLSLRVGVGLLNALNDLLAAGAQVVKDKRHHWLGRPLKTMQDLLDALEIGQSEVGSYVLLIQPQPAQKPLAEQVFTTLAEAILAVEKSTNQPIPPSDDALIQQGVSVALCRALEQLASLTQAGESIVLETHYSDPQMHSRTLTIHPDTAQRAKQIRERLEQIPVRETVTLTGVVISLDRQQRVQLRAKVGGGKTRTIIFTPINDKDLQTAKDAYPNKKVEINGMLVIDPKNAYFADYDTLEEVP